MLQVPYLRENTEEVIAGLSKRNNLDARERVLSIIALDDERRPDHAPWTRVLRRGLVNAP
jgi:seryl-tRNA synthetase